MLQLTEEEKKIQEEWYKKGTLYAWQVNKMVAFGESHGWDNWEGGDPIDKRSDIAPRVLQLLKKANYEGEAENFRELFPPAYEPLAEILEETGHSILKVCLIEGEKVVAIIDTCNGERQAFMIDGRKAEKIEDSITYIGRSPRNGTFAIVKETAVTTYAGWGGAVISGFMLPQVENMYITDVIPYNDGMRVLLVTTEGIFLLGQEGAVTIHPVPEAIKDIDPDDDYEWTSGLAMGHAALSPDNTLIALGDQCSEHRILNAEGIQVGEVYPESSYPDFALFSKDGGQVVLNACHFYNGITIGVDTKYFQTSGTTAGGDANSARIIIEDECRVNAAVATSQYYIFGDSYGYLKAFTKEGEKLWRYFLGSTVMSIVLSDDEKTVWAATYAGVLHRLRLDEGQRDKHTIGTGQHYEEFRMLFLKDESNPLVW